MKVFAKPFSKGLRLHANQITYFYESFRQASFKRLAAAHKPNNLFL